MLTEITVLIQKMAMLQDEVKGMTVELGKVRDDWTLYKLAVM